MSRHWYFVLSLICMFSVQAAQNFSMAQSAGTLLDRNGEMLRGTPLVITGNTEVRDISNPFALDPATLIAMQDRGLNTVRLCLVDPYYEAQTRYSFWTLEEQLPLIDEVIESATALGMNVILNYHSVGEFNRKRRPDFSLANQYWETLAPRYADNDLVFYELINEPSFQSDDYLRNNFKTGLTSLYQRVRELAPQRQILMFSFNSLTHDMESIINAYSADMDWEFTSVAWHAYGANETSLAKVAQLMQQHRMICTEWDYPGEFRYVPGELDTYSVHAGAMENIGCGWIDWRDWDDASFEKFDSILIPDSIERGYAWTDLDPGDGGGDDGDGDGTDPGTGTIVLVHDVETSTRVRGRNLQTEGSVVIVDDNGDPVEGATVSATWSGAIESESSAVTDSNGLAVFEASERIQRNSVGSVSLSVVDVDLVNATYDASQNVESASTANF